MTAYCTIISRVTRIGKCDSSCPFNCHKRHSCKYFHALNAVRTPLAFSKKNKDRSDMLGTVLKLFHLRYVNRTPDMPHSPRSIRLCSRICERSSDLCRIRQALRRSPRNGRNHNPPNRCRTKSNQNTLYPYNRYIHFHNQSK